MNTAFGLLGTRTLDGDTDRTVLEAQRASAGRAVLLEQGHKGLAVRVPSHLHTWTVWTAATSALILVTKPQPSLVKTSTVTARSVESSLQREWASLPPSLLAWGLWGPQSTKASF